MRFKSFFIAASFFLSTFGLPSSTFAQGMETLDFIQAKLADSDINVIDFSLPENQWGSLPLEWVERVQKRFSDLENVASFFEDDFEGPEGLNELRYQKVVAQAKQTQVPTQAERLELQGTIDLLNEDIQDLTEAIQEDLTDTFSELDPALAEEGGRLLFNELEYYFSTAQWGGIPYSLARALKQNPKLWSGQEARNLKSLAQHYLPLGQEAALEGLKNDLADFKYLDTEGKETQLKPAEVELIFQALVATQFEGERQLNEVIRTVVGGVRNLLGALAILWIVVSGIRMALAQGDENVITEQKRSILYAVLGLVVILLLEQLINALYGPLGQFQTELKASRAFDAEVYGLVSFIRALIGTVAVAMLVRSGVMAIFSQGAEDEITKQRQSLLWVVAGLVVIAINRVIVENIFIAPSNQDDQIYSSNIANIIGVFSGVMKFALGFFGLIALGILVYAAGMMIANYGDEEMVTKAKTMIKNAIIGIVVVIAAYALVATLVTFG